MTRPLVVVASQFLLGRRADWDDGFELIGPDEIGTPAFDRIADQIEVIVSGGEALDRQLVDSLPGLKLVACFATGYAGIDLRHLRSRGVALTTAAGPAKRRGLRRPGRLGPSPCRSEPPRTTVES